MLLVAAVAVRAVLPWVLEWSIEWQGTKQLGRVVEIGDVDLALFPGGFAIEELAVGPLFEGVPPPLDPEEAHFRSARIEVNWSWLALLRRELHLESVALAAPELLAVRGADGHLVPVLRPRPSAAPSAEAEEPEEPGAPWPLLLDRLRLRDMRLLYVDLTTAGLRPLELEMDQFALDELALRGDEFALGGLGLRGPRLRVRRDIDLAPFTAGAPEAAPAAESAPVSRAEAAPTSYRVAEVALERAGFQLVLDGREIDTRLSLHAREVSGAAGTRFPLELRIELEGGWLELEGEAGTAPAAFDGTLSWADLPLEPLAVGAELPLTIASGRSSGALQIDAFLADAPERGPSRIDVSGRVQVDALDAATSDDSLAVSWSLFELELGGLAVRPDGEGGRPVAPAIELAALRLRDPAVRVLRRKLAEPEVPAEPAIAAEPGAPVAEAAGEAAPAPELRLALLELSGGAAEFVDETVTPPHRSQIRELSVRARDLRWPEREAGELVVAARGPEDASFALDASLRGGSGRVKLDLADLGLAAFSPYSAEAAGYWIEGGNASLRVEVGVAGEAYDLDSDLGLHRLDVAEVEAGSFEKQFGVPLDLGLALLRDPGGNIGIPIAAKLEGGKTSVAVASVVAAALRQALVGALTAPLKGLGMLVGSGEGGAGLRLEPLGAAPGARAPELAQLAPLGEMLEARPGLGLRLHGRVGPEDEPALAERILMEQVVAEAELPPVEAGFLQKRRLHGALEDRARGETGGLDAEDAAALARWVEAVEVTQAERSALAEARATAVRDTLVAEHGIAAQRIELGAPLEGTPGVVIELAPAPR